jgi:hypothetical protein
LEGTEIHFQIDFQKEIKRRKIESPEDYIVPLPSLGEALTKKRGDELVQSVKE